MDKSPAYSQILKFPGLLAIGSLILTLHCCAPQEYEVVQSNNPEFRSDSAFVSFEDTSNPKFAALKKKYQLDTVFHGETDEMKRILLLRNWISKTIPIDDYGPYEGDLSVESILDEGLKGNGFHCGHFTAVQNAVMNAYGYVTRCLIADVGVPVDYIVGGGHHAINEVWSNAHSKWVLSDAKYDYHFEKEGIPLSALEVRDEYFKNKAADITLVKGPERAVTEIYPGLNISKEQLASVYTWLSWGQFNNRYSNWPKTQTDFMLVYNDDYFEDHVWLWNGKRHWAYDTEFMILVDDRKAIEWTPNVIASNVKVNDNTADVHLYSITPNLKTYQMRIRDEEWQDVSENVRIQLESDDNSVAFRAVNMEGVKGPEHKLLIKAITPPSKLF